VNLLEDEIGVSFRESFREFLELTNGLNVFSDSLAIFGRRTSYDRTTGEREPYNIVSINLYDRPKGLRADVLLIGSYSSGNGFLLYIDPRSRRIYQCRRSEGKPIKEWENFGQMLLGEVNRLDRLFDDRGVLRYRDAEIVPGRIVNGVERMPLRAVSPPSPIKPIPAVKITSRVRQRGGENFSLEP
jgi:hypothetical protein